LLAIVRGRRAHGALQFDDVDLAGRVARVLEQPAPGAAPLLDEIRADQRCVQRFVADLDGAIHEDHGNSRRADFAQHGIPAGFDHGREGDHVDVLAHEGAQRRDLLLLAAMRILEPQDHARVTRRLANGFRIDGVPVRLGRELAEAEHHLAPSFRAVAAGALRAAHE
jgi:hypothetical protein